MENREVVVERPVVISGVTLIPVVKVSMNCHSGNGISFFGFKQPISVVLALPLMKRAFRITGEEIALEQLIQEVPDIKEVLERI